MVGPLGVYSPEDRFRASSLMEKNNVFFVGPKHRDNLPGYYAAMDVALMPYKLTEHTEHISPLKMLEYMAFRKPTVSTDIPAAREYDGVVEIGRDTEQFSQIVAKLLSEDTRERVEQGFDIAKENSWDDRVETMSQVIHEYLCGQVT